MLATRRGLLSPQSPLIESEQLEECVYLCVFGVQGYSNPFCCDDVGQSSCSECHGQRQHGLTKNGSQIQSSEEQVG